MSLPVKQSTIDRFKGGPVGVSGARWLSDDDVHFGVFPDFDREPTDADRRRKFAKTRMPKRHR